MTSVITADGLTKTFGTHRAVDSLDFEVAKAEVFGFLGPNGTGKSTTIRLLMGLYQPTAGTARVLGLDPLRDAAAIHRQIGYLPGELALHHRVTGRQHIDFAARARGLHNRAYPGQLAERFGVILDQPARALSKGNRQKVGIVLAFMHRPDLLILDEPTAGLDPLMQAEFERLIRETAAEGRTVFLSSHELDEVQRPADRIAIIKQGQLIVTDTVDGLRQSAPRTIEFRFACDIDPGRFSAIEGVRVTAARKLDAPYGWELSVYTAGTCHLSGPTARELKCTAPEDNTIRLTGRAPSLRGHRAFWAGTWDTPSLAWQYARNGWAEMALPFYQNNPAKQAAARRDAVKIASQIRYGAATPPLLFPIQLTHLPSRWRVSSVTYVPGAGVLRASSYALGAGPPNLGADGGLVYETGLPYFDVNPRSFYGNPPCYRGERGSKTINGYQVVVTNVIKEQLCAPRARGLIVVISEFGAQPAISVNSLFGHHLRLLGPNPANWTSKPIG